MNGAASSSAGVPVGGGHAGTHPRGSTDTGTGRTLKKLISPKPGRTPFPAVGYQVPSGMGWQSQNPPPDLEAESLAALTGLAWDPGRATSSATNAERGAEPHQRQDASDLPWPHVSGRLSWWASGSSFRCWPVLRPGGAFSFGVADAVLRCATHGQVHGVLGRRLRSRSTKPQQPPESLSRSVVASRRCRPKMMIDGADRFPGTAAAAGCETDATPGELGAGRGRRSPSIRAFDDQCRGASTTPRVVRRLRRSTSRGGCGGGRSGISGGSNTSTRPRSRRARPPRRGAVRPQRPPRNCSPLSLNAGRSIMATDGAQRFETGRRG